MEDQVILVNREDQETGTIGKMQAHLQGLLHRAVSVLIFNSRGEWLLQKRAAFKYHSGGLWSNACCTHPYPGESPEKAAQRRLAEEMGLTCPLSKSHCFIYQAQLGQGLAEHEYDHVFIGHTNILPVIDPEEVSDWCYISPHSLHRDEQTHPEKYTIWFRHIYRALL